jgi:Tfp pilus assembly major pilin PilA
VTIVVIGILAAITIVSYANITKRAIAVSLQSDLSGVATKIKAFEVDNGNYPGSISDCPSPSATNLCMPASSGNSFTYQVNNISTPKTFTIHDSRDTTYYRITENSPPIAVAKVCPQGFIVVPGSATYGTSDFCVMKYEAKQVGASTTPISQASGLPWVYNTQLAAIANSPNVAGCTGCHLITEAEWMTIAKNIMSVGSNWSSGVVGTGSLYLGHTDTAPISTLEATTDDNSNWYATGNAAGSNQRRTFTLTNGEIIWDISGNVHEWTSGQTTGGEPGVTGGGAAIREWTAITNAGTLTVNASPGGTGLAGSGSWNTSNGVGNINSNADESVLRGFIRSNDLYDGANSGLLSLITTQAPSYGASDMVTGFRVAK